MVVITPEYRILVALMAAGSLTTEELWRESSLSRSGYFHAVNRLKHGQFIACEPSPTDRRRKTYRLDARTAFALVENLKRLRRSQASVLDLSLHGADGAAIESGAGDFAHMRLQHLSGEYQILLHLYFRPGSTSGQIANAVSTSPIKFHNDLAVLLANGLITCKEDCGDKRRRRYRVSDWVSRAIKRMNDQVIAWPDELDLPGEEPQPPGPHAGA